MGAYNGFFAPKVLHGETVQDTFSREQKQAAWEFGHGGYTGTIAEARGVSITNKHFEHEEEAEMWCLEHAEKWGPALAVTVGPERTLYFGGLYSS